MFFNRNAFRKDMFWHTDLVFLQTNAFKHRCFYRGVPLPAGAFTHRQAGSGRHFHTDAFTQRCLYTGMLLHTSTCAFTRWFLWHRVAFTPRSFYTHSHIVFMHLPFTHRYLMIFVPRGVFLHNFLTERCFYMWVLLDLDTFRQRNSYMGEAGDTV